MSEIATRNPSSELADWATGDERRAELAQLVPDGVSVERFAGLTRTALLKNPGLLKADRASLWLALRASAAAGLVPDGKQAAIVVYGNTAQFIPMIQGVRDTLAEYGWALQSSCVYEADAFGFDEAAQRVTHVPPRLGTDRGALIGAYAQATLLRTGFRMVEVMTKAEIDYVRDKSSRTAKNGPWVDWYSRMAEKTPAHRLAKKLPLDPNEKARMDRVLAAEELEPEQVTAIMYGPAGEQLAETGEILEASPVPAEPAGGPAAQPSSSGADGGSGEERASGGETPTPSVPALSEADQVAGIEAALAVAPGGKYGPDREGGAITLGEIWKLGDRAYLRDILNRGRPGEWRSAIEAFARLEMPEDFAEIMGRRAEA